MIFEYGACRFEIFFPAEKNYGAPDMHYYAWEEIPSPENTVFAPDEIYSMRCATKHTYGEMAELLLFWASISHWYFKDLRECTPIK